jgi:RNA polymerase subunit RPABC4/transcription elongation factor Spt4
MKNCRHCGVRIPDHAHRCPHCRGTHPRGGWLFQAFLIALVTATALAVLLLD